MTIPTPVLDKARSEELTSYEIFKALDELATLNRGGHCNLVVRSDEGSAYVEWQAFAPYDGPTHYSIEAALTAEADELRWLIEEERAS